MDSGTVESIDLETAAAHFSALGDPIRLRILGLLAGQERCVCELNEIVGVAPNLLSYHLRVLREAGLVEGSRRGRWVDYRLTETALNELHAALPGRVCT